MFKEPRNRFHGIGSVSLDSLAVLCDNPICRTGLPGYIGWRNRFLGIDSELLNLYNFGLGSIVCLLAYLVSASSHLVLVFLVILGSQEIQKHHLLDKIL